MTQVFLNYRADDDPFGVAFLDEKLSNRFGEAAVFLASKSIPVGARWEEKMFQAVADSAAVLVIIGRGWLEAKTKGRRSLENEDDFVRREILAAFEHGKRVIPVRLGVPRLSAADLPSALADLAECQDIEIRFRSSKIDVDRLATELATLIPELPKPTPATNSSHLPNRALLAAGVLGLAAAVAVTFASCGGPDQTTTQSVSVPGNSNDVDQNAGAHNEASSGACAQFGDNNTCVVQLEEDVEKASAGTTDAEFKAELAKKSTARPTEPGPWPYVVVDTVVNDINEGLWARSTNLVKGDHLGVALNHTIIWADCTTTSDYSPLPDGDANNVGPRWLFVRWNNAEVSERPMQSNPSDGKHAWMYLGYAVPMYHNGDIPECAT